MLFARISTLFAFVCVALAPTSVLAARGTTDPAEIAELAAEAYTWGLGPEYIYRFSLYNTIIGAPFNAFKYGAVPAAWNNEATNAGDASVLYVSGFIDFTKAKELVLTVPPSTTNPPSKNYYYVVAYYDAYANTIGSIGTRTTPSTGTTSYLLVGPDSKYASQKTATIHGHQYPVMASDTNINWFLIRILTNTLIDATDPTSVPNVLNNVVHKFALNTLHDFEKNGYQPVYPGSFVLPSPSDKQIGDASPFQNAPTDARTFFTQLGEAVRKNPIPEQSTGLSGMALQDLPSYMAPQAGASTVYVVPSAGQKETLARFEPIGLTEKGFREPNNWGQVQRDAFQAGYDIGRAALKAFIEAASASANTNYWGILNDPVGTYPNTAAGYLYRSLIVVEGGVANIALDAIYPTLTGIPSPLDGNNTYKLTFTLPTSSTSAPAKGIYPPMVNDSEGNPKGFWSIHVYASDPKEGAAPFIAQTSVLNTHFSTADRTVFKVDASADELTVQATNWGRLVKSTPILFDGDVGSYGLTANTAYYVATDPVQNADGTYTFKISTQWLQVLSSDNVPIQGPGGWPATDGKKDAFVDLLSPAGAGALNYGMVKPVTQLGSTEHAAGLLSINTDGSLTLWFGPKPPRDAPASNWIPTPSTDYYSKLYPQTVSTKFQLTLRMYYPAPGDPPPSILKCSATACPPDGLAESYIPSALELVDE
jgi:hypothetical protein